ncbi:toxin-antitoxin system YwqK family antitoxin [Hymenobacter sp. IS2118]|uniref:toxin-antitoxin system YwqK family antitoxin n=1 Tax=Hymenobacter sp. IS2118 TaxID=1505605 RepID=UPI0009DEE4D7|nr:toxin-antitoxin system YwqK family antitoxin [Hymenobacter sp. IS2118]
MPMFLRGASLVLLLAAPFVGASQQNQPGTAPKTWPKPGQLITEGIALHDKQDYAGAIAKYSAVTPGDSSYATALSELALSLNSAGKQEAAVAAARQALALNPFESQTYNTLADAQEELKQIDAALATYQQALRLFPYNQGLYYNQGVTHLRQLHTAEALTNLQHSLELAPTKAGTHRLLGLLAAQQGHTSHALVSWLAALALAGNGAAVNDVLIDAERLSQGVAVVPDNEKAKPVSANGAFEELDQLLESKVALQAAYASKVKFQAAVVKQTQLLVEKFPVDGPADDFWIRAYGPMVAALRKDDNLTAFTYLILQSAEDKKAAQWVKSNQKKVDAMLQAVMPPLVDLRARQQLVGGTPGQRTDAWFNDNGPDGLGPGNNQNGTFTHTGEWISLTPQGAIDAVGRYNTLGQRVGLWKELRPDGTVDKTYIFNDKGELEGLSHEFHANGQPAYDVPYRAGKIEGVLNIYNECGARTGARTFKAGELDGPYASYHPNGQVQVRATLRADKVDGLEEGFYQDGTPEYTTMLANGVKQGPFMTYYPDKTPQNKGTNDKDKREGAYVEYHPNGVVSEEGRYAQGKRIGTWRTNFTTGKLSVEKSYDEAGELHGLYHDYDEAGHHYSDTEYAHGRTVRVRYFDKAGKTTLDQAVKKGRVAVQLPGATGEKGATGTYLDGQMVGEWQWFYRDGSVREITHYDDKGDKFGSSAYYYHGGQLQRRLNYAAGGQEEGYYEQFTLDGQPATTGYYQAGQRHGQWKDYYANGNVSEEYEYFKGVQNGPARSFEPGGKLTQERFNEFDKLRRITTYDSVGKVLAAIVLKPETKEYSLRYPSGKPLYRTDLICYSSSGTGTWLRPNGSVETSMKLLDGQRHGAYKATFANNTPERFGEYRNGLMQGEWLTYYPDGQLQKKGRYRNGQEEGEWTSYFPNGKVESVYQYQGGDVHGLSRRYNPAGELLVEKMFEHGELVSFRGPAEAAPFQPLPNMTGAVATTFANGKPAAAETFDHNVTKGTATFYYSSGEVFRRSTFLKGLRTGPLESFYPGGKRMEEENYLHGVLHGRCRYYRPDGTLEREETYRSGERSGPTTYYSAAGKPERTDMYWNLMVYDKK